MQTDRLTTLDEFGSRRFVIPAEVMGHFRTWRHRVYFALLLIFLLLPWVKVNGLQAVWLDIPGRRFEIFGQLFLAHDAPMLFLVFASLALLLGFATAVWGRVWCGWACPQTVFIDSVFRRIEIWVEGDYISRRKLRKADLSWKRIGQVILKWSLYLVASSVIAHSLIAYFTGSARLLQMIRGSPSENWTYFLIVLSVTSLLMFNFGWFREQFCTIMCPYGRFQSVLMDEDSLAIVYDEKRGEPRKGASRSSRGDCVSCNRCVQVCPAGIDIRKGIQMECIACTACIDACDEIMKRVKKPTGLIRYGSVSGRGASVWRPRAAIYLGLALLCSGLLAFRFLSHAPYSLVLLRAQDTPYQQLPDDRVLNHFKMHVFNQTRSREEFAVSIAPELKEKGVQFPQGEEIKKVEPGESLESHLFVTFPRHLLNQAGETQLRFVIREAVSGHVEVREVRAVGPASHVEER